MTSAGGRRKVLPIANPGAVGEPVLIPTAAADLPPRIETLHAGRAHVGSAV